ncbi:MAG: hypothetical protein BGN92_00815 [Sphingobacteriales bacterium 41-5]|nr:MAG: hypothetical protein BGN92_00815 [Sphingobacteriales bacterium 41-5]
MIILLNQLTINGNFLVSLTSAEKSLLVLQISNTGVRHAVLFDYFLYRHQRGGRKAKRLWHKIPRNLLLGIPSKNLYLQHQDATFFHIQENY